MACLRRISLVVLSGVLLTGVFAGSALALEKKAENAIIQNCDNIKQSLTKLQYADSRTRTYLGSAYEAIAGRFITPLNLRLVKNNLPSAELFNIQGEFSQAQTAFRENYVDYMRELDNLIAADCANDPKGFYAKLETTRTKREALRKTTKTIAELVDRQYKAVQLLRESL